MHAYPRGTAAFREGPPPEMCSTKSVVGGQAGPSDLAPVCRSSTRAAAFSLPHDTSRTTSPREPQSAGPRNTAPWPGGGVPAAVPGVPPAGC